MVGLNIKVRYGLKFSDKSWRNFKTNTKKKFNECDAVCIYNLCA